MLPPCPDLPPARERLDWRVFAPHGRDRGPGFYVTALEYGQYLWTQGFAARAILCLDRAFGAELRGDEPELRDWPLPYSPMAWFLRFAPEDRLVGNPRVHFQHYADRLREPRRDQRRWRAWACWALTRKIRPELPGDPRHRVQEPSLAEIAEALERYGHPGEPARWQDAFSAAIPAHSTGHQAETME